MPIYTQLYTHTGLTVILRVNLGVGVWFLCDLIPFLWPACDHVLGIIFSHSWDIGYHSLCFISLMVVLISRRSWEKAVEMCHCCGVQVFSTHYRLSNPDVMEQFVNGADTVLLLAFATVLLNTDLHNACIRPETKMTMDQFVHNLRGQLFWSDSVCPSSV